MNERGFTLLEALVAMTIVGMVSIGTLGSMSAAIRVSDLAVDALVADELAEERLASLLALPAEVLSDSADGRGHASPIDGWSWRATVSPAPASSMAVLRVEVFGPNALAEASLLRPSTGGGR